MLRPLDLYVCLFLATKPDFKGYEALAQCLGIALGTAHNAVKRLTKSGLVVADWRVNRKPLAELVIYGVRYFYYAEPGSLTRGLPTADAAQPLVDMVSPAESPYVWPDPEGPVRGLAIKPLHESAIHVARRDIAFYELLALTDAMRVGRARVRELAENELRRRLTP